MSEKVVDNERLPAYLVRLGGSYERAALSRDYDAMRAAEQALVELDGKHEWVDCGLLFRRGRNAIRKARGLESVASW